MLPWSFIVMLMRTSSTLQMQMRWCNKGALEDATVQGNACFPSFSSCFSTATLAYGRCKWKLCEVGVASALFIRAAYEYNTVVSNSATCPFLGDVSGRFVTSQSSIGCFLYSIGLCYCIPSSLGYIYVIVNLLIVTYWTYE
jgi:hypothetical protein